MQKAKFTVRVDGESLRAAKNYAQRHHITMTRLIEEYLRSLARQEQRADPTPVLHALTGTLRSDTSLEDYHTYLEQKYLGDQP